MATLIKTDGSLTEIEPKNGQKFELEELQQYVQGYIELVFLKKDRLLVINDDGKSHLSLNEKATEIAHNEAAIYPRDYICGDAVLCKDWEA